MIMEMKSIILINDRTKLGTKENVEIVVPLKHLSIFWRTLDMP